MKDRRCRLQSAAVVAERNDRHVGLRLGFVRGNDRQLNAHHSAPQQRRRRCRFRDRLAAIAYLKYEMTMERVTASIDGETLDAIREIAGPRGVSAFLQTAARERLARLRLLGLLDELDTKHGAPNAKVKKAIAADAARVFRRRAR